MCHIGMCTICRNKREAMGFEIGSSALHFSPFYFVHQKQLCRSIRLLAPLVLHFNIFLACHTASPNKLQIDCDLVDSCILYLCTKIIHFTAIRVISYHSDTSHIIDFHCFILRPTNIPYCAQKSCTSWFLWRLSHQKLPIFKQCYQQLPIVTNSYQQLPTGAGFLPPIDSLVPPAPRRITGTAVESSVA